MNTDTFIEQLISKQYDQHNFVEILNQNARNKGDLALYLNDSK